MSMRPHILLGVTGSVAARKLPELLCSLIRFADIKVILTQSAMKFVTKGELEDRFAAVKFYTDEEEKWTKIGEPILHIELRKWTDLFLIAPLSANSLAKISNGFADNLLTCVTRCLPLNKRIHFVIAPAMNTLMWEHPMTSEQLRKLVSYGVIVIKPIHKKLACGDTGIGAIEEVENIAIVVKNLLDKKQLKSKL